MKTRILSVVLLTLIVASLSRAQYAPGSAQWPGNFIDQFPSLQKLQASLKEEVDSRPAAAILPSSGSGSGSGSASGPNSPHVGRFARFDAIVLDNMKLHADGTYSDTLAKSLTSDGQNLTPFQLTGVKFIPTFSLTYEVKLGDLTKAHRQWVTAKQGQDQKNAAERQARAQKDADYASELQKLLAAYVQFQELRAQFLDAQQKQQGASTAFYKLKAQAVAVLATAHYSASVENDWLAAEYQQAPRPTSASLEPALQGH